MQGTRCSCRAAHVSLSSFFLGGVGEAYVLEAWAYAGCVGGLQGSIGRGSGEMDWLSGLKLDYPVNDIAKLEVEQDTVKSALGTGNRFDVYNRHYDLNV